MGIFEKFLKKIRINKDSNSKAFCRRMAMSVNGQHIKYVTEKRDDVEEVIGRNGGLNVRNDEMIVFASSQVVFRCKLDDLQLWELLSGDGIVLTGPDLENGGLERTLVAFYVYHRR